MTGSPVLLAIGALHVAADDGIVADAAVAAELGCRSACVASCVLPAEGAEPISVPRTILAAQLGAALAADPRAARVGRIASDEDAEAIAAALTSRAPGSIVLAPELLALPPSRWRPLLPLAAVAIARAGEARDLDAVKRAASRLRGEGARAVLIAGASVHGRVLDLLDTEDGLRAFDTSRVVAPRVAGLAGSHASALAAHLARGESLAGAAEAAQRYVGLRLRRGR